MMESIKEDDGWPLVTAAHSCQLQSNMKYELSKREGIVLVSVEYGMILQMI